MSFLDVNPLMNRGGMTGMQSRRYIGNWDLPYLINGMGTDKTIGDLVVGFMSSGYVSSNAISFIAKVLLYELDGLEINSSYPVKGRNVNNVTLRTIEIGGAIYIDRKSYVLSSRVQTSIREYLVDMGYLLDSEYPTLFTDVVSTIINLILQVDQILLLLLGRVHKPHLEHHYSIIVDSAVLDVQYTGSVDIRYQ